MIIDKSDKSLQQKGGMNNPPFLTWPHFKKEKTQGFSMHTQNVSVPFVPVFHNAKSRANPKWPLYGPAGVLQKHHESSKDLWHWDCPKCWKNRNILEMSVSCLQRRGGEGDGRFAVDSLIFGASECFWMKKNSKDRWVQNSYGPSDNTMGKGQ